MSAPDLTDKVSSPQGQATLPWHPLQQAHAVCVPSPQGTQTLADQLLAGVVEAGEHQAEHPSSECRRVVGHTGQNDTVVVLAPEREAVVGKLCDRSPGAIAVVLAAPVAVGSILLIMMNETARVVVQLQVEVRHCRAEGTEWVVECDVLHFVLCGGQLRTGQGNPGHTSLSVPPG
jgi:hypothetical protein